MKSTLVLVIVAISLATAGSGQATELYYEGFDYTTGALDGKGGWSDTTPAWSVGTPGATYTGLAVSGNTATGIGVDGKAYSVDHSLSAVRGAANAGNTLYFTMLNKSSDDESTGARISVYDQSESFIFDCGVRWVGAPTGAVTFDSPFIARTVIGNIGADIGLIALKFDVVVPGFGNDTAYYAVNPDLSLGEPAWTEVGAVELNYIDDIWIDAHRLIVGDSTGNIMDEIRWGTTWDDVAPPGTVTVIGDANGDGQVTDADYTIWADTYNSTTDLRADWNGDGQVTDADYTIWADNYGFGLSAPVPEPAPCMKTALDSF